jgi:transcriptional regulator with XRE-family HTH domain
MPTPWARYVKDVTAAAASQKDIAAASGVTPSVLSRWLSGRCRRPSAEQAIKLAQAPADGGAGRRRLPRRPER